MRGLGSPALTCPASWTQSGNNCYKLFTSGTKDWNNAQNICKNQGSFLASIKTSQENDFLSNFGNLNVVTTSI